LRIIGCTPFKNDQERISGIELKVRFKMGKSRLSKKREMGGNLEVMTSRILPASQIPVHEPPNLTKLQE
jgi:hypothetical protein